MGLELNLLCFTPFLMQHQQIFREVSIIYFLTQACGSILLLISGISILNYETMMKSLIIISILLKIGAAPLHFWYIWVARGVSWYQFIVLRTVQKVGPLVLLDLRRIGSRKWIVYLRIIFCGVVGGLGGVRTLFVRNLLVYSSINHLGWLFIPLISNELFWWTYFVIYCIILVLVVIILIQYNISHVRQIISLRFSKGGMISLLIRIFSLSGLPPFLGFFPKWGVIILCRSEIDLACLIIMILSSVISIYFYTRLRFNILTIKSVRKVFNLIFKEKFICSLRVLLNLLGFWLILF